MNDSGTVHGMSADSFLGGKEWKRKGMEISLTPSIHLTVTYRNGWVQ